MDNTKLLEEITKRLDDSIALLRDDTKELVSTIKDHEVRILRMEGSAGQIKALLALILSGVTTTVGYLVYKAIDIWAQKG